MEDYIAYRNFGLVGRERSTMSLLYSLNTRKFLKNICFIY